MSEKAVKTETKEVAVLNYGLIQESFNTLKEKQVAPISDTREYFELEEQTDIRVVFIATGDLPSPDTGEMIPAAVLLDENGGQKFTMSTKLVQTCIENNYQQGDSLYIKRLSDRKGKSGKKYHDWEVRRLIG